MDDKSQNDPSGGSSKSETAQVKGRILASNSIPNAGSSKDNTHEQLAPPPDERWAGYTEFALPTGEAPLDSGTVLEEWRIHAARANVVVIAGSQRTSVQWLAESFAHGWKSWSDIRCATGTHIGGLTIDQIIDEQLLRRNGRCLILDSWFYLDSNRHFGSLPSLEKLVKERSHHNFGLVLWTDAAVVRERPGWPANVHCYLFSPAAVQVQSPTRALDARFFNQLFGGDLSSLDEVLTSQKKVIERTLARICVLFGDLPEADMEALVDVVIGDQTISSGVIGPDGKGQSHACLELWRMGKQFFLKEAGMVFRTDEIPCRIGFASAEARRMASEAAWKEAEAMIRIFSRVEGLEILFSDDSTRHRRDLYEGYLNAAVTLARRAPNLYGHRWLDAICEQYIRWASGQSSEIKVAEHRDLFSLLQAIAENEARHAHLWRRFAQRMGFLCSHLCRDSLPIVEEFFHLLASKGLHSLLWMLVVELMGSPIDLSKWVLRIFNENPTSGRQALLRIAAMSVASRNAAQRFHALLASSLPELDQMPRRPCEAAAIALPALILTAWSRRAGRIASTPVVFSNFLELPLDGDDTSTTTIHDYWGTCFRAVGFDEAVREWSGDTELPADFSLALALFQTMSLCDPPTNQRAIQLADGTRRADPRRWRRLRERWKAIVGILAEELRVLPLKDATHGQRCHLNQAIRSCQQLNGL